ncbi:MAG: D-2-hydroxyacid dehydrogenase [Alphaproteobacteria bacterium]|nr:D-2-hydroxyacid dehydrogenase [Alphaproteobacteria bacterium]
MSTKKKPSAPAKKAVPARPPAMWHLHCENTSDLSPVFAITAQRVKDALARFPKLKGKLKVTLGQDGDIYPDAMKTAHFLFGWKFDRTDLANRAPNLKMIHVHGAGVNHVMPLNWLPAGCVLTNSRGVHGPRAAEYLIMAILMLNNRLPEMVTHQRAARWQQCYNTVIMGKTVLVIGVGHIGGSAADWAKKFGLNVWGVRRSGKPHRSVDKMFKPKDLPKLLPKADFVVMCVPATDATKHLMGRREINMMRKGTGFINYSRADLVDYDALRERLIRGELSAILDVFDPEPLPPTSPLWATPNLIMTPHCSSDDTEAYTPRTLDVVLANVERMIAGKPPVNVVDAKLQY